MNSVDEMWIIAYKLFEYHRKPTDPDAKSALNRVAMKCLKLAEQKSFTPDNCSICEEIFSIDDLQNLVLYHDRNCPKEMEGPIVVLVYDGRPYVIEGNNRTNAWRAGKYNGPFTALVLKPKDHAA
jgi:hypothetical protein